VWKRVGSASLSGSGSGSGSMGFGADPEMDPDPAKWFGSLRIRIQIRNTGTRYRRIQCFRLLDPGPRGSILECWIRDRYTSKKSGNFYPLSSMSGSGPCSSGFESWNPDSWRYNLNNSNFFFQELRIHGPNLIQVDLGPGIRIHDGTVRRFRFFLAWISVLGSGPDSSGFES